MRTVDGADGGGQVVRSALALSLVTGEAVELVDVRGSREPPGLKAQHLAAVEAAAAVGDAAVPDLSTGDREFTFDPGEPGGGEYAVDVGTAGSVTLVFDTLLPVATVIDEPLRLTATGGTDVKWSPPADYHRAVKLPLLRRAGLVAALDVGRRGFYPVGGGAATLTLGPSSLAPLALDHRGAVDRARVRSVCTTDLAAADVAARQADRAAERLADAGLDAAETTTSVVEADCAGSVVVVVLAGERTLAGFDAHGERGTPAEDVADEAVEQALAFREGGAAVDRHLADQVLLPLALAGGTVRIPEVTDHVATSLDLLETFGYAVERAEGDRWTEIGVEGGPRL